MTKKTVSERAKEKALEMKKEKSVVADSKGVIGTISGIEPGDINMPYVYVVQKNSKNATLPDGKEATPGQYFHNTKRQAYNKMDVLIAFAKKGTAIKKNLQDKTETEVPAYRAVMLPVDNLHSPFIMTFKQMALWHGWKPYLSELSAKNVSNLTNAVVMTTDKVDTSYGSVVYVPSIKVGDKVTDEQINMIESVVIRFGGALDKAVDEDEETDEVDIDGLLKEIEAVNEQS